MQLLADDQEPAERAHDSLRGLAVRSGGRPVDRRAEVRPLLFEHRNPLELVAAFEEGLGRLGELQEEGGVSVADGIDLAGDQQLFRGVLADRLEEAIPHDPGIVVGLHQRAVNQPREEVEHVVLADAATRGHPHARHPG